MLHLMFLFACSEEKEPVAVEENKEITRNYLTENHFGSATVVPNESFEGREYYQEAQNSMTGVGVAIIDFAWDTVGIPEPAPEICSDCIFAFDVQFTFNEEDSTNIEDQASCYDMNFSYALGTSEYGQNTLFYGYNGSWGIWIVEERAQIDDEGTEHLEEVSFSGTEFTYSDGRIDVYEED